MIAPNILLFPLNLKDLTAFRTKRFIIIKTNKSYGTPTWEGPTTHIH